MEDLIFQKWLNIGQLNLKHEKHLMLDGRVIECGYITSHQTSQHLYNNNNNTAIQPLHFLFHPRASKERKERKKIEGKEEKERKEIMEIQDH